MMKERFAKLLLGEDLSGGGKGVSTALAVSNAITNLSGKNLCMNTVLRLMLQNGIWSKLNPDLGFNMGLEYIKPRFRH